MAKKTYWNCCQTFPCICGINTGRDLPMEDTTNDSEWSDVPWKDIKSAYKGYCNDGANSALPYWKAAMDSLAAAPATAPAPVSTGMCAPSQQPRLVQHWATDERALENYWTGNGAVADSSLAELQDGSIWVYSKFSGATCDKDTLYAFGGGRWLRVT